MIIIRKLVSEPLEDIEKTNDWWNTARIPEGIKSVVKDRIGKEIDSAITKRSNDELDYTTFGELSDIIISNWDIFGSISNSQKAVQKAMASLKLPKVSLNKALNNSLLCLFIVSISSCN
jgi:hypothetical protein